MVLEQKKRVLENRTCKDFGRAAARVGNSGSPILISSIPNGPRVIRPEFYFFCQSNTILGRWQDQKVLK